MKEIEKLFELQKKIEELAVTKERLKQEIIQLDDEILFQEFGVFQPQYSFADIDDYKIILKEIREEQKEMIRNGTAAICNKNWRVEGSESKGKKLIAESKKQIIRNFNMECDFCIDKVRFSTYESSRKRIFNAFEIQNRLNETNATEIAYEYYKLKIKELDIAYEYQQRKKEEKERLRELKEQQREEAKVAKEMAEKRTHLEKEKNHYENAISHIEKLLAQECNNEKKEVLKEKHEELKDNLTEVYEAINNLNYREANQKAGYVYIISNIGAFGENVYKIGMTRRLEPEERIAELSGAAVPFKYDIHAMIFCNDAPKLEAALHKAFAEKKLNLMNPRKEFFKVTLEEIKEVVQKNYDKVVEFKSLAEAEQYRESEMLRKKGEKRAQQ